MYHLRFMKISVVSVVLSANLYGLNNYYSDKQRGWYFFENPPVEQVDDNKTKNVKNQETSPSKRKIKIPDDLPSLTASEIRELEKEKGEYAVQHPDDKKAMKEHLQVIKYLTLQSEKYAAAYERTMLENDDLNFASDVPTSGNTNKLFTEQKENDNKKLLDKYSDNMAFLIVWDNNTEKIFQSQKEEFSEYKRVLLEKRHQHMKVHNINVTQHPSTKEKLNLSILPAVFIIFNDDVTGEVIKHKIGSNIISANKIHSSVKKFLKSYEESKGK